MIGRGCAWAIVGQCYICTCSSWAAIGPIPYDPKQGNREEKTDISSSVLLNTIHGQILRWIFPLSAEIKLIQSNTKPGLYLSEVWKNRSRKNKMLFSYLAGHLR